MVLASASPPQSSRLLERESWVSAAMAFEELKQLQQQASDNPVEALDAAHNGVAICDRSHWGRISVLGGDHLSFLHNQSTNDLKALKSGQGCETVFVTSTARTIDLATAYVRSEDVVLLVSPNRREALLEMLDRYIFFGDAVSLNDITEHLACFSLIGPHSHQLISQLAGQDISAEADHSHRVLNLSGVEAVVANGSGLGLPGYTLFCDGEAAVKLWQLLREHQAVTLGDEGWEQLRIQQGRPAPDRELTEAYNPLEAGLWQTISFDKGCYIGQETIARLNTYNGVKTRLWGIQLNAPAEPGSVITLDGAKVGSLTSMTETNKGPLGLAYVRTKVGGAGLTVQVGESSGVLVALDYVSHPEKAEEAKA